MFQSFNNSSNHQHHSDNAPKSVLVVCLGNICRSPMAEEALKQQVAICGLDIAIDSAGTSNGHVGEVADSRAIKTAKSRGYHINKHKAKQVSEDDFYKYDIIMAMDKQNLDDLLQIKQQLLNENPSLSADKLAKVVLFAEADPNYGNKSIDDPYQGDEADFEQALDRIDSAAKSWVELWR